MKIKNLEEAKKELHKVKQELKIFRKKYGVANRTREHILLKRASKEQAKRDKTKILSCFNVKYGSFWKRKSTDDFIILNLLCEQHYLEGYIHAHINIEKEKQLKYKQMVEC